MDTGARDTTSLKRAVMLLFAAALVVPLLAGCSGGGGSKERKAALTTTESSSPSPTTTESPPSVRHGKPATLEGEPPNPKFGEDTTPPAGAKGEQGLDRQLPTGTTSAAEWNKLSKKAQAKGSVAVIVELKATGRPEPLLSDSERTAQRKRFADEQDAVLSELNGKHFSHLKNFGTIPFVAMHTSPDALDVLRHSPHVAAVSEDRRMPLPEPRVTAQGSSSNDWLNLNPWWDHYRIGADTSWVNGYDGRGWTVAILDTGVEATHPWISGKVVAQACFATNDNGTGACSNGSSVQYGSGAAAPCTFSEACGHGTHVAGIAAGIYGVARQAKIIAIKVFHKADCTAIYGYPVTCPLSSTSDQVNALKYVYSLRNTYRIAAVNLSIGGPDPNTGEPYPQQCDSADADNIAFAWQAYYLRSANIATVVSSGNDSSATGIDSPACISQNVSVGNTTLDFDATDAVYAGDHGSDSDQYLSLLAPGTAICSAFPISYGVDDCNVGVSNHQWTGTSMAAPQVTGAIAALKQLRSWATVGSEVNALQASGLRIQDDRNNVTKSRINVWSALVYLYNH